MKQRLDMWAIRRADGVYIGLDESTGGYPYIPANFKGFGYWINKKDAENYKQIMNSQSEREGWEIVHVTLLDITGDESSTSVLHRHWHRP